MKQLQTVAIHPIQGFIGGVLLKTECSDIYWVNPKYITIHHFTYDSRNRYGFFEAILLKNKCNDIYRVNPKHVTHSHN